MKSELNFGYSNLIAKMGQSTDRKTNDSQSTFLGGPSQSKNMVKFLSNQFDDHLTKNFTSENSIKL
jgi:hypothetical protein